VCFGKFDKCISLGRNFLKCLPPPTCTVPLIARLHPALREELSKHPDAVENLTAASAGPSLQNFLLGRCSLREAAAALERHGVSAPPPADARNRSRDGLLDRSARCSDSPSSRLHKTVAPHGRPCGGEGAEPLSVSPASFNDGLAATRGADAARGSAEGTARGTGAPTTPLDPSMSTDAFLAAVFAEAEAGEGAGAGVDVHAEAEATATAPEAGKKGEPVEVGVIHTLPAGEDEERQTRSLEGDRGRRKSSRSRSRGREDESGEGDERQERHKRSRSRRRRDEECKEQREGRTRTCTRTRSRSRSPRRTARA
jgi:hypothetical protein